MRWQTQLINPDSSAASPLGVPPPLVRVSSLLRSVQTPEFAGITFHEVLAKTALNQVPLTSKMLPGAWTVNPYRGCSHACLYCYARNTHRYLDLDTGADFDSQIVVKVNVAEVLARELTGMTGRKVPPERVALGTNTDPYQRAEGRYVLMPGIIEALAAREVPFSILTKGTLLRRDLALLADVDRTCQVSLAMSIAVFDDQLQQSLEPGTPTTAARLATVRQIRDLGLECAVFLAPVVPELTDSVEHLDRALAEIKAAGATSVFYTALRLGADVKEWYLGWLEREHPELLSRYQQLYGSSSSVPSGYRRMLDERMRMLLQRHHLPGGVDGSLSANRAQAARFSLDRAASLAAAVGAAPVAVEPVQQPQLF
ncbi:MAG TPA: Rv2578c family radical SAM protein [Propionibacteriaceae bacterium]|nr:Rv2578c family radical SAM protein [Propionibacteriaceae bacterium]